MRLRNIPGSREIIAENPFVVPEGEPIRGHWKKRFGNENPVHIEIGMGKGRFLITLAEKNPNINYVGIERYSSVLLRALQKMEENPLPNLLFLRMDAETLEDIFEKEEVSKIYLNFSDPWPKDRHAKRRLTSRTFLARYDKILKSEGRLEFKTDNRELFDFSVEELAAAGWKAESISYDLHNDPILMKDNIMTEYEERFSSMGNPICKYSIYRERKVHERKDKKSEIEKD
ncbi:MAG: tRNA (guanosine(46)-N7)-methyltransferase TrmB [Lachnospiraceae bacterium]|jgi:tRNA (guanine-N7-)-methyltransferase|nr:tRNA (guanosine(46)-N7)-methyltransferase TrmB [Lachnospiraceae bacterium]